MPDTQTITVSNKVKPGLQTPSQVPPRAASQTPEPTHQLEEDQRRGTPHHPGIKRVSALRGNFRLRGDGSSGALALNGVRVRAHSQLWQGTCGCYQDCKTEFEKVSARLAVIVGYTAKLTHTNTHTHIHTRTHAHIHTHTSTHTAVNNEAVSAGFKELVPEY